MSEARGRESKGIVRMPPSAQTAAADVEREIALHLEMLEADLVAQGMSADGARAEAVRRFGDRGSVRDECVSIEGSRQERVRRREWLAEVRQDVQYALRALRRAPGFAVAAIVTLAVGLGATIAMFSVVDAVLLRRLPLPGADQVVAIVPRLPDGPMNGSPALLTHWREESRTLLHVAGMVRRTATLLDGSSPSRITGAAVSGEYFGVLGVAAARGRGLQGADDTPGAPNVMVVSDRLWRGSFGSASDIVGSTVQLDGTTRVIVGVMPPSLDRIGDAKDFWVPLRLATSQRNNFTPYLSVLARVRADVAIGAAEAELDVIVKRVGADALRDGVRPVVTLSPLLREITGQYRRPLLVLLGATVAILLIACVNVSTLMLARSVGRSRELAVRAALGAGRSRLVRQLITEHLTLAGLAVLLAWPIALGFRQALVAFVPADIPRMGEATLDVRAAAVAALLAIVCGIACGLAPVVQLRTGAIGDTLRGTHATAGRQSDVWRKAFVATEVALALMLLTGAGLLLRSALSLSRVKPGFDVEGVMTARLALPTNQYPELPAAINTFQEIVATVRREPGVARAALVSRVPLGGSAASIDLGIVGQRSTNAGATDGGNGVGLVNAALRVTSADYFGTMGIPIRAGRDLSERDVAGARDVVVVNESLAKRLGVSPNALIGQLLVSDNSAFADAKGVRKPLEVVGVTGDVLDGGLRGSAEPEFYLPMAQVPDEPWDYWINREMLLVARGTTGNDAGLVPAMRRAVAAVDGRVPLYDIRTTGERVQEALAVERFALELISSMGILALLLASLGIHGVVSYVVSQRQREAGVRLALGATAGQVVSLVVRQSMRPVLAGIAIGIVGSLFVARAGSALLFGVTTEDPIAYAAAGVVMLAVGAVACYAPARRMSTIMPAVVLRGE